MSASDEATNPLYGLQVGSCVKDTGKFMIPSVIEDSVTKTILQTQEWKSMSGQSSYAYTKEMNQGSFGLSGSYGFSGLSKVDAALSAYVGKSSATGGKSVKLGYQVKVLGGIQHIDFDNLTASTLATALSATPRQKLQTALENYIAMNAALLLLAPSGKTLADVLKDRATYATEAQLFDKWLDAVNVFNSKYGDGVVIAVAWGGIGTVTLDIRSKSDDTAWKYGGEASFSYAGVGGSVAVSAAYDGSQSKGKADVDVTCDSFASGACVQKQTDAWFNTVSGKAFSELADVDILAKAPDMTAAAKPPSVPAFIKPTADPTFASKLGQVKDLKGLEVYAQACAYDKAVEAANKAKRTPPSFSSFLKGAGDPAEADDLKHLNATVSENTVDTYLDNDNDDLNTNMLVRGRVPMALAHAARPAPAAAPPTAQDFSDYVPLGVWIANWANLFPWLATGYLNSITDIGAAGSSVRYRVLMQDFLALSKLYYIVQNYSGFHSPATGPELKKIGDSFASSCATLQHAAPGDYETAIKSALKGLSKDAESIYKTWNKCSFLRNCELGLAVLTHDGHSPQIPSKNGACVAAKCGFDPQTKSPFSEFADCYKVLPIILPDGDIYALGPDNSLLSSYDQQAGTIGFGFPSTSDPLTFHVNAAEKTLDCDYDDPVDSRFVMFKLYPVPFSAANGIDWKGQAFSVNVAADASLTSQLEQLTKSVKNLPAWSFSSEAWSSSWTGDDGYSMSSISKQYVGLVDGLADKLG